MTFEDHNNPELGTFQQRYWHTYEFYEEGESCLVNIIVVELIRIQQAVLSSSRLLAKGTLMDTMDTLRTER